MKIWIYLNGVQQGPYSPDQLRTLPIDASTPVWYEGLPQWTPAGQAPATMQLFAQQGAGFGPGPQQPPYTGYNNAWQQPQYVQTPPRPSTYIVWSIILTILCCSPFALAAIVTGAISSSRYTAGDYAGAKDMSTATEWLLILSIVWAVAGWPLGLAYCCS